MVEKNMGKIEKAEMVALVVLLFIIAIVVIILQPNLGKQPTIADFNTTGWSQQRIDELNNNLSIEQRTGIPIYIEVDEEEENET